MAPAGYGTLTGLPLATAADVARPIVVVDIAVGPGTPFARGLGQADVVYQEFDNAGTSRLICAFQSTEAPSIGPVTTTAPVDARITSLMGLPVLAFAGGSAGFLKQVGPTVVTPRPATTFSTLVQPHRLLALHLDEGLARQRTQGCRGTGRAHQLRDHRGRLADRPTR